ncbi:MAG: hypothetical protein AB7G39_04715 [Alphaproteobacteria bacterium]
MSGAALFPGRKLVFLATLAAMGMGAVLGSTADAAEKKSTKADAKPAARKLLTPQEMLGMQVLAADNTPLGRVMARRMGAADRDLVLQLEDEVQIPQLIDDGIVARPDGPGARVTTLFGPQTVAVSSSTLRPAGGDGPAKLILRSPAMTAMR